MKGQRSASDRSVVLSMYWTVRMAVTMSACQLRRCKSASSSSWQFPNRRLKPKLQFYRLMLETANVMRCRAIHFRQGPRVRF